MGAGEFEANFDGDRNEDDRSHPLTGYGSSPGYSSGFQLSTRHELFKFSSFPGIQKRGRLGVRPWGRGKGKAAVEIKRTIPRGAAGVKDFKTKRIFVGGIPTSVSEEEFKEFFSNFGEVKEHQIMRDHFSNHSRGFGFITFNTEEAVDGLLSRGNMIEFAGTKVEIKNAKPKKPNAPKSAYGDGFGDGYGGYGGGGGFGPGPYWAGGGTYGGRASAYSDYVGTEFGGFGGYGRSSLGASYGYSGQYGGGFNRSYDMGDAYGGPADGYGGYSGAAAVGGYGGSYVCGLGDGSSYGGGSINSSYGAGRRDGHGATGSGRYHPYAR
ncbi:hypothetical protein Ancab_002742 [Ancistrocladus abbreviatus]